jgi:hypothetical protein
MTTSATASGSSNHNGGYRRVRLRFRAFAIKVVALALLVLMASLPIAGTVVDAFSAGSADALRARSGRYQLATYNLPHVPHTPEGVVGMQRKRKRTLLKALGVITPRRRGAHREIRIALRLARPDSQN